jgi:hypothetical protein
VLSGRVETLLAHKALINSLVTVVVEPITALLCGLCAYTLEAVCSLATRDPRAGAMLVFDEAGLSIIQVINRAVTVIINPITALYAWRWGVTA